MNFRDEGNFKCVEFKRDRVADFGRGRAKQHFLNLGEEREGKDFELWRRERDRVAEILVEIVNCGEERQSHKVGGEF